MSDTHPSPTPDSSGPKDGDTLPARTVPIDEPSLVRRLRELDQSIESELEEAMGGMSAREMYGDLSERSPKAPSTAGGGKKAKVVRVHGADVFVDVPGGRSQGVLPAAQFPDGPPAVGSEVEVHIEGYDEANGLLLVSRKGAAVHADWSSVAEGQTVEARVTATNKGGLEVDVNGIRGFLPISQIDLYRVENTEPFVNQRLKCLIVEVDPEERNLVVSRRALLEREREENREKLWAELAEGQVRPALVRSLQKFGAFVDLGGVDALLHVSELSWKRVQDPSEVVQPGQTIQVVVLKIDRERRKVGVGLKQLIAGPWDDAATRYIPNTVVHGTVTRLAEYGAFVELEPGLEGLVHVSELAPQRVRRVQDVVQPGQEVDVLVLQVDPSQKRISLSLKGAASRDTESASDEAGAEIESPTPTRPARARTTPLRGGLGS